MKFTGRIAEKPSIYHLEIPEIGVVHCCSTKLKDRGHAVARVDIPAGMVGGRVPRMGEVYEVETMEYPVEPYGYPINLVTSATLVEAGGVK